MGVQPLAEGSSTPCGLQVMGSPLDESLAEWLRVRAGVHERILDKTLLALEEVEVFEVEDLVHLERLPDFALSVLLCSHWVQGPGGFGSAQGWHCCARRSTTGVVAGELLHYTERDRGWEI